MTDSQTEETSHRPTHMLRAAVILVCVGLGAVLFLFMGNTHDPSFYGPSILSWLVRQWLEPGSKSGHGWLVPAVSLFIVWTKRKELAAAQREIDNRALIIIAFSLFLYWAGYRSQQPRFGVLCLIFLTWAIPLYLCGNAVARLLFFPCCYLLFAVPLGFLVSFTFPLRLFASAVSASLLNGLGIAAIRQGTAILSVPPGDFALDVADSCSGLRSLIAMSALTAAYAYLTQKGSLRKWILFLFAVPFAMAGNVARIVTIAIAAKAFGQDIAMKIYHDFSGYIVFITAVILMMAFGALLKKDFRNLLVPLKRQESR